MGNLGLSELVVIFIVALLVIGPRRLPEVARGLGEAMRSFQDAMRGRPNQDGQRAGGTPSTSPPPAAGPTQTS